MKLDMPVVLEQLRYTGMLDTIRIRKLGYPVRLRFGQFADRYRALLPERVARGTPARDLARVRRGKGREGTWWGGQWSWLCGKAS